MKQKLLFTVMLVFSIIQAQGNQQVSTKTQLQGAIDAIGPNEAVSITIINDIEIPEAIIINNGKKVSINGEGKTLKVTVPGSSAWRLFEVDGENTTLSLSNLILKGGALGNTEAQTNYGGAIYAADKASLVLEDVTLSGSKAYKGGAVFVAEGNLQIKGTATFTDNEAYCFGGAVYVESADSDVEISSTSGFKKNTAKNAGGAIYLTIEKGQINIGDDAGNALTLFSENRTPAGNRGGGALFITQGSTFNEDLNITLKADFQNNESVIAKLCNYKEPPIQGCFDSQGGGCYVEGGGLLTIKEGTVFNKNIAEGGAGLYLREVKNIVFEKNVQFTNNKAIFAGALCIYKSEATIEEANFTGNTAIGNGLDGNNGNGSVIFNEQSKLTIKNSTFENNLIDHAFTKAGFGAICSIRDCELLLENCSFINNTSIHGGAIFTDSKLDVINCDFQNNTATQMGGAIYNNSSELTITNTLFANNEAKGYGGGALFSYSKDNENTSLLTNVTIAGNKAANSGGGIFMDGKIALTIHNSIIWGNISTNKNIVHLNPSTTPITYAYSLVEDITDDQNGNIEGIAANKPIFAGNINPSSIPYYNLDMSSPGIDAGSNDLYTSAVLSDLAGNERIGGGMIEMGAYESKHINVVYHSNFNTDQTALFRFAPGTTTVTTASYGSLSFPERADHYFTYWTSQANGGTSYGQTIDVTGNSLYHLYAKWSENPKPPIPPVDPEDPNNPDNPDPNPDTQTVTISGTLPAGVTIEPGLGSHAVVAGESLTLTIRLGDEYDDKRVFLIIDGDTIELKNILRATTYTHTLTNVQKDIHIRLLFTDKDGTPLSNAEIGEGASIRTTLGTVHIQTPAPATLQIITMGGRVITQQKLAAGETSIQLPAGFYIVILSDGTTQKIMIRE